MTEAEAFAALRDAIQTFLDENQLLRERLAALEEESRTHDPSPLSVPTPHVTDLPMSFREPKIDPRLELDGKVSEYATFLDHCDFYFDNKPSMFLNNDKNKVFLVISRLVDALPHGLMPSAVPIRPTPPSFRGLYLRP